MQIIPLFLVVCACLGASWGERRGKLAPYAHRRTKASCENTHASLGAHEMHPTERYTQTHTCSWACIYMLTSVCIYNPNTYSTMCSGSHSEAHVTMNMGQRTTVRVRASPYVQPGTHTFTTTSAQQQAHKCLSACAHTLFSNPEL